MEATLAVSLVLALIAATFFAALWFTEWKFHKRTRELLDHSNESHADSLNKWRMCVEYMGTMLAEWKVFVAKLHAIENSSESKDETLN